MSIPKQKISPKPGLNYLLSIERVTKGDSVNGPYLNIRATTKLRGSEKTITAMLFLNRGRAIADQKPTKASQAAWDKFSNSKRGDSIRAFGEIRSIKSPDGKTSAYFAIRSLSATLPIKKPAPVPDPTL
jgi:hypothetical protein